MHVIEHRANPRPAVSEPASWPRLLRCRLVADALNDALAGLRGGGALEAERLHAALQQRMFGGPPRPVRLGRFTILERIGEGAMGEVYSAHDPDLDRRVALKLIRPMPSADSSQTEPAHQRLRREAQAMARLSHPHVVTVHEVGELDERVYVVMELVDGMDLRRWLDRPRPWREIVDVFLAAGRGLAAAHEAGVIHRDFKPHNVLLGDDGRVRVADFGLAGLDATRSAGTMDAEGMEELTQTGAVLGTPAYMAPEQREGKTDARADQYAFCVALFEALHGHRPSDAPEGPPRPRTSPRIDAVIQRGLQEDPEARYPSMDALIEALEGARRRRWLGATVVATLGLAGLFVAVAPSVAPDSPLEACRARASRWDEAWTPARRDGLALRLREDTPERVDEALTATTRAIDTFAEAWRSELDDACRATHAEGVQSTAMLGRRLGCLDQRLDSLAVLLDVLAEPEGEPGERATLAVQGLPSPATCGAESIADAEPLTPEAEVLVARQRERIDRAHALVAVGRSPEAVALLAERPPASVDPHTAARLHQARAEALLDADQLDAARTQLVAALVAAETGEADRLRARSAIALADLIGHDQAEPVTGLEWAAVAEAVLDRLDDAPALRIRLHHARGNTRFTEGRYEDALTEHRRALELARTHVPDGAGIGAQQMTVANTLLALGRADEAREQLEQALVVYEQTLGPSHPRMGLGHANLSNVALAQGRLDESAEHARTALEIFGRSRPPGHADWALAYNALGTALASAGDLAASIEPFERAVTVWSESLGARHPRVGNGRSNLALACFGVGRYDDALEYGRGALAIYTETLGPEHPDVALVHATLGRTLLELERPREALEALERARTIMVGSLGPDHAQLGPILFDLGRIHLVLDDPAAALAVLRRTEVLFEANAATPVQRGGCAFRLGQALWRVGEASEARSWLVEARRHYEAAAPAWRQTHLDMVASWAQREGIDLDPSP